MPTDGGNCGRLTGDGSREISQVPDRGGTNRPQGPDRAALTGNRRSVRPDTSDAARLRADSRPRMRRCAPRRSTRGTARSAPAWCRSPATRCRCSIPTGILAEHLWTRENAGLFDVSHMGQAFLVGADHETAARGARGAGARPISSASKPGQQRYTQLLNDDGGILDDLMVTRSADPAEDGALMLVVNAVAQGGRLRAHRGAAAGRRAADAGRATARCSPCRGRRRREVLARHRRRGGRHAVHDGGRTRSFDGIDCHVSRSGYTGEDGFEISVAAERVEQICATRCWPSPRCKPIGLGARDSLRLEAGLCLYGHDIDETTSPVEAGLVWSIAEAPARGGRLPRRRAHPARAGRRPGAQRVGLAARRPRAGPRGRRDHHAATASPSASSPRAASARALNGPIAMGYVDGRTCRAPARELRSMVRGKRAAGRASSPLPFVPHRYVRNAPIRLAEGDPHGRDPLHQGPRMDPRRRRRRHGRHHRLRAEPARRRRLRRAARGRQDASPRAARRAVVESVKAASEVYAPVVRRGGRGQRRARRTRPAPSTRTPRARAGSSR